MRKCVWAGGFVLCLSVSLAGCASLDLAGLAAIHTEPGGEKVVEGSVKAVAESTHRSLTNVGIDAKLTQKGEEYHITSQTTRGGKFDLVLTRDLSKEAAGKERTHIKLLWEGAKDDQLGGLILTEVEIMTAGITDQPAPMTYQRVHGGLGP